MHLYNSLNNAKSKLNCIIDNIYNNEKIEIEFIYFKNQTYIETRNIENKNYNFIHSQILFKL